MATDLTNYVSGRLAVADSADVEVTLNPSFVYMLASLDDRVYYTTNGDAVTIATTTAAGHGILGAVTATYGAPEFIHGVSTLKMKCDSGDTGIVIITRAGVVPLTEF